MSQPDVIDEIRVSNLTLIHNGHLLSVFDPLRGPLGVLEAAFAVLWAG